MGSNNAGAGSSNAISGVTAQVTSISESRGGNGYCRLSLSFSGSLLTNYCAVLRMKPLTAFDDTGADLCPTNTLPVGGWQILDHAGYTPVRSLYGVTRMPSTSGSLTLRATTRAARTIKELEGELELYSPTLQNGGIIVVEDFRKHPGVVIPSPALRGAGIQVTYHTKESFETTREHSRKDPKEILVTQHQEEESQLFPGILGDPENSPRNYVVLKATDPDKRLAGFGFCSPEGRFVPVASHRSVNDLHAYKFIAPALPAQLSLYVYVTTPSAMVKVPFRVEDIPLP